MYVIRPVAEGKHESRLFFSLDKKKPLFRHFPDELYTFIRPIFERQATAL